MDRRTTIFCPTSDRTSSVVQKEECRVKSSSTEKVIPRKKSIVLTMSEEEIGSDSKESLAISVLNDDPKVEKDKNGVKKGEGKWMDAYGMRISPAVVKFDNTFENQRYTELISVQNISDVPRTVRILSPRAWSFRLRPMDRGYTLAPGLKISRYLHYTSSRSGIVHSNLPIYIDEHIVEVPLEANKGQAFVDITPTSVKFGRIDIGCKPVQKKVRIRNVSFCATKFLVDLGSNEMSLQVEPMKGWIRPNSSVTISLKLIVLKEGIHTTEFWITTDLCQTRIHVEVEACRRSLMVFHPNTINEFTLIDFPMTFYGCRRYQTLVVCNMSASTSSFVVLIENASKNPEPFIEAKKGDQRNVKMFDIEPVEGKIRPFEERIFTFWFNPKLEVENQARRNISNITTDLNDYLCTVRIKRIQVDDSTSNMALDVNDNANIRDNSVPFLGKTLSKFNSHQELEKEGEEEGIENLTSSSLLEEVSVLLYLYGEAEVPTVSVAPDALYFPNTPVGTNVVRVVHLKNETKHTLAFKYMKVPFFDVLPDHKKLSPKSTYDVTVKLNARNIGSLKTMLTFEILAEENSTDELDWHVVNRISVKIYGNVKAEKADIQPKFNPGITPLISHEVGILTDEVTFASKVEKPRCALTVAAKAGRPWHETEATIAFPNDRPLTLRPRLTDKTAKTIYKGLPRYLTPIDESQTYTPEKLALKKEHDDRFLKYLRGTAAMSALRQCCCKWNSAKMENMDPPVEFFVAKEPNLPREIFVPLTMVQLYRIKIEPPLISFGSVTTSKLCSQELTIFNENGFEISARVIPLTAGIYTETLEHFVIPENSENKVMLNFQRERLGRYSGTITCVINGFHSFDIAVVAEVVHRSLTISPDYLEVKIPDIPFGELWFPVSINNPLNIPINFSWVVPEESPIKIEPTYGVAPKLGSIWCGVLFEPDNPNYKLHPLKLMVEGTSCLSLKTGVILPKTNAFFMESVFNVGYIPMNLTTERRFIVVNPDYSDAMFVILNKEPVKGVKVIPSSGSIKAKSCHSLLLSMTVSTVQALDFIVYMNLQNSSTIEMKVIGNVVLPEVEVFPKYINFHRVPCNSVTRTTLTAENKSKAKVEIAFMMEEYPQFKVSLSKRYHDQGLTNTGFTLEHGAIIKFYLHFIPKDLASYDFHLPILINGLQIQRNSFSKEPEAIGKAVKTQSRKSTVSRNQGVMTHSVFINVVVLKACLVFSTLKIYFSSTNEMNTFSITNVSEQSVGIIVRFEDFQGLFDLSVDKNESVKDRNSCKLTILPAECVTYSVTFVATCPGVHISDLSILTSFEDHGCVYNTVRLIGIIPLPCIITSPTREIYFQPVPLNTEISYIFDLDVTNNEVTKEITISHEIDMPNMDVFTIEYPKGNIVTGNTKRAVPVKVTFKSDTPLSLRKRITFTDRRFAEYYVLMIATADISLLTTHAFVKARSIPQVRLKTCDDVEGGLNEKKTQFQYKPITKIAAFQKNDNSSGGSRRSLLSAQTTCSSGHSCKPKKNVVRQSVFNYKESTMNVHKDKSQLAVSDTNLSLQLENDEKLKFEKPSEIVTEVVAVEGETSTFPIFPLQSTLDENVINMQKTLSSVEQWVYEQVFCCSYNPSFGSHSFSSFSVANRKDYGLSSSALLKNVFDALERICGRRIRRFFTPIDKLPEDLTSKVLFTHRVYRQLVDFMEAQGALMAHVEPKYLMVYEEYCLFYKYTELSKNSNDISSAQCEFYDDNISPELMSPENFRGISVQCWLDLFLQMFKIFILGPAVGITNDNQFDEPKQSTVRFHDYSTKKSSIGRAEEVLLTWLTQQYNSQRTVVWPNDSPPPRAITNFDIDLEDGLVLMATTAAYCPYLNKLHFENVILHPSSISHAYHNATCLCLAWASIKLGFSITPRDFINSNTIKMLLLVTHLYTILPSYKPEATITFKAILNDNESQIVTLTNDEEMSITYQVEVLPNSYNFILEDCQNSLVLKRKSKGNISVRYMARSTNKAEAILLICGACMPPRFGRNYVFKLEGFPVKLPVSSSFNIISPQNIAMDTEITVLSPHALDFKENESFSYELWITYTEPQPGNLNAIRWAKEKKQKMPRRLFFTKDTLIVYPGKSVKNKHSAGVLPFKVCCYSQLVCQFWLIFRNPDVGDFIVKLQVTPRRPDPVQTLCVTMDGATECRCNGEHGVSCNRTVPVRVPCRNMEQWAAVRTMFELTTSPEEKDFWASYIESNIGFRLLQWILAEKREVVNKELEDLFKKSKTYKVSCTSKYVSCTTTLDIPDVRCNSSLPLDLHLNKDAPSHTTVLTMTSTDGFEIRCYKLKIVIEGSDKQK